MDEASLGAHAPDAPFANAGLGRTLYEPVKTVIEWLAALALFIALLPLLTVLAALVKATSPGPAFYRQRRVGKDGRIYWMYKLRSMMLNCESASGIVWSQPGDPRVTPVGRWLRDTHLDEIPQLLNILAGSMTLIGPRPERPEIIPQLELRYPTYRRRTRVKPGLTGLAQMQLPADRELAGVKMKLAHDFYYVDHLSPLLDLRIAISTGMYFLAEVARIWSRLAVGPHGTAVQRMQATHPVPEKDVEIVGTFAADLSEVALMDRHRAGSASMTPQHKPRNQPVDEDTDELALST